MHAVNQRFIVNTADPGVDGLKRLRLTSILFDW